MDDTGEKRSRGYWRHFEPSWTLDRETRGWLCGTGDLAFARRFGFALAAAAAVSSAAMAVVPEPTGFMRAAGSPLFLTAAVAYLALGMLLRRGKRWASLALLALFTTELGVLNLNGYSRADFQHGDHLGFWAGRVVICTLTWMVWVRVFYLAYRLERRAADAATDG